MLLPCNNDVIMMSFWCHCLKSWHRWILEWLTFGQKYIFVEFGAGAMSFTSLSLIVILPVLDSWEFTFSALRIHILTLWLNSLWPWQKFTPNLNYPSQKCTFTLISPSFYPHLILLSPLFQRKFARIRMSELSENSLTFKFRWHWCRLKSFVGDVRMMWQS